MNLGRLSMIGVAFACSVPAGASQYELTPGAPPVYGTDQHVTASYEDTLLDIARRASVGYEEIQRANPHLDLWIPGAGADVLIPGRRILPPGPHEGIVVNLPEHRLYYYPKPRPHEKPIVITYPVSVGKMDWRTPLGETQIVSKQALPNWYPPASVIKEHAERGDPLPKVVPPGPDNPLGEYAMRLAIHPGTYLIHGTNNPLAVGMAVTHGCIRMYPEDIEALFKMVPVGTKVWLVNEPVKVAYVDGELLLEAHPQIDAEGQTMEPDLDMLSQHLDHALGANVAAINWDLARETLQAAQGMPALVGLEADPNALAPPAQASAAPPSPNPAPAAPPPTVTLAPPPPISGDPAVGPGGMPITGAAITMPAPPEPSARPAPIPTATSPPDASSAPAATLPLPAPAQGKP
jgi:L,D-transpeptidase ErfK/SrfK